MPAKRSQTNRILVIAPQPFYQERGTPIAVRLLVESLIGLGLKVDLATYHEGAPLAIDNLRIFRIEPPKSIRNIPIGFSIKKIICDVYLGLLIFRLNRQYRYPAIHAIEESVFLAHMLKFFFDFKLVYDADSSLVEQMVGRFSLLNAFLPAMEWIERIIVRRSDYLFPVCPELASKLARYAPKARICILNDPPLPFKHNDSAGADNLLKWAGGNKNILLYIGNLEHYQGVDLVVDAMALLPDAIECAFVVIGGRDDQIEIFRDRILRRGLESKIHLIGPRPLSALYGYLKQARILISPRRFGHNTPMKIYSYLASGKPVIATDIKSHTQILNRSNAMLVKPEPESICSGITALLNDVKLRERLGTEGQSLVERSFSREAYRAKLGKAYADILEGRLA